MDDIKKLKKIMAKANIENLEHRIYLELQILKMLEDTRDLALEDGYEHGYSEGFSDGYKSALQVIKEEDTNEK